MGGASRISAEQTFELMKQQEHWEGNTKAFINLFVNEVT